MEQFKSMSLRATGIKAGKFAILIAALSIPVLNVVVGAALVAKIIYSLSRSIEEIPERPEKTDYQNPVSG